MCLLFFWKTFRYLKLQKGHAGGSDVEEHSRDSAAKYVILEEMDEQEDGIWNHYAPNSSKPK